MSESFVHLYDCRVRWSDVDAFGHVNNVKYFEYFQESRINFLTQFANMSGGRTLVVARVTVDYKRPIFFRSAPYPIRTRVVRRGRSSFDLYSEIVDGDLVLAHASAVLVGFDAEGQKSRAFRPRELDYLDRMIASE